ncbi:MULTISPECIES: glycosyltransferase [unclassified Methanosarcina]|uniref:glycosyltransferase n=1 Tax=unclassified Methanosarcina TaxID=2644672 RepID=UPI000615DBE8|nr:MULTISPECIES: glycosyltransferase [unclassified Methanosarcina]AKB17634.1 Glycosyl transferase, group 1 [Methanosarcina sp. WWM596]AKB21002.1 Glycosyl transferase, group 1 [Methanosarcina sp. WH1]
MIKVLMCGPLNVSGGVSVHTKSVTQHLSDMGIKVHMYNFYGENLKYSPVNHFFKVYRRTLGLLFKAIKLRSEYDIIHVQASGGIFSFISAISASFASKICSKKLCVTLHYRASPKFIKKYKSLFSFVLSTSSVFFVVSKEQKEIIKRFLPSFNNVMLIPNGIDPKKFKVMDKTACRITLGLPLDKLIVLSVGNLVDEKGHQYFIKAARDIVQSRKDILCIIIGTGNLRKKLDKQIKDDGLEENFKLVGVKPHSEIPIWMNACDIFVFPSLVESFGTAQIEAMACGKPIVATYNGGSEGIIISSDYGLLCETANSSKLAENILKAINKSWNKEDIVRYSKQFSWENIAKKTISIYNQI